MDAPHLAGHRRIAKIDSFFPPAAQTPMTKQTICGIPVYVPTGEVDTRPHPLAPRLAAIEGVRIGILDNCKEFADLVLRGVADVLQRDYGAREVRFWQKSYLGIASPYAGEMAAQCDAVINGVGH
jgi:hypothetical protein